MEAEEFLKQIEIIKLDLQRALGRLECLRKKVLEATKD